MYGGAAQGHCELNDRLGGRAHHLPTDRGMAGLIRFCEIFRILLNLCLLFPFAHSLPELCVAKAQAFRYRLAALRVTGPRPLGAASACSGVHAFPAASLTGALGWLARDRSFLPLGHCLAAALETWLQSLLSFCF